ncbi:MAG TPA: protein-disulfide reductase DsbD N-terminal domain-containing protein [Pyrinomonadaceae bacterium]|nr:protein-disulfide reductase DsbD N-terminal domain-containing protein [Pyrinomonadaceae bacterium]
MRRKNLLLSLTFCLPFALASCGGGEANRNGAAVTAVPSPAAPGPAAKPQPVTATVEEAKLDAGGEGEARVRLDIAQGFHTHANPASDKYYIPTELRAEPQEGITPGQPVYPPGVSRKLEFFDKPLALYEGSVVIKLPLRADKGAAKGRHTLRTKLRVQHCDDKVCFPPQTIDAPIPVTVN